MRPANLPMTSFSSQATAYCFCFENFWLAIDDCKLTVETGKLAISDGKRPAKSAKPPNAAILADLEFARSCGDDVSC